MYKWNFKLLSRALLLGTLLFSNAQAICVVSGCNNEVCASDEEEPMTTCLWKAEYQCYNEFGVCEEDSKGVCGWRQSSDLLNCLQQKAASTASDKL